VRRSQQQASLTAAGGIFKRSLIALLDDLGTGLVDDAGNPIEADIPIGPTSLALRSGSQRLQAFWTLLSRGGVRRHSQQRASIQVLVTALANIGRRGQPRVGLAIAAKGDPTNILRRSTPKIAITVSAAISKRTVLALLDDQDASLLDDAGNPIEADIPVSPTNLTIRSATQRLQAFCNLISKGSVLRPSTERGAASLRALNNGRAARRGAGVAAIAIAARGPGASVRSSSQRVQLAMAFSLDSSVLQQLRDDLDNNLSDDLGNNLVLT
jgi:hypothetical protein